MIMILMEWAYMATLSFLMGFACLAPFRKKGGCQIHSAVTYMMAGLLVLNVYAEYFSLFAGVGFWTSLIAVFAAVIGGMLLRRDLADFFKISKTQACQKKTERSDEGLENSKSLWRKKNKAVWLLYAGLTLLFAYGSSRGYMHYDTGLYHAQAIRWIEEYGVVPGLANLHSRFGYNSASFALSAFFSETWLIGRPMHCVAGFFALLCLLCIASGNITTFLIYMLAVISHECAHCVMADMLGYEVCSIELMPYGCRAEIVGIVSHLDEFLIALAGPVFSLIAYMGTEVTGLESLKELSDANMYIALVNMLPVYPLDGGRAFGAALEIVDIRLPYWANTVLNIALSIVLIFLGCMAENPTVTVFGVFLLLSLKGTEGKKASNYLRRAGALASCRPIRVRHIALSENATLSEAISYSGGGKYTVITALDGDMRETGRLDSGCLNELAAMYGCDKKIREVLPFIDRV